MFKWLKDNFTRGEVKYQFIALDDDDEPYQDVASLPYRGAYDEFTMHTKLRRFLRTTRNHVIVEIVELERREWQSLN